MTEQFRQSYEGGHGAWEDELVADRDRWIERWDRYRGTLEKIASLPPGFNPAVPVILARDALDDDPASTSEPSS